MNRRDFIKTSCCLGAGMTLTGFGLAGLSSTVHAQDIASLPSVTSSLSGITATCTGCSVGCGIVSQANSTAHFISYWQKDPLHPINQGITCPHAPYNQKPLEIAPPPQEILYRAAGESAWQTKDWNFAVTRIAELIKQTRDAHFAHKTKKGEVVNRLESVAMLMGAGLMNEESWVAAQFARSLGVTHIMHEGSLQQESARIALQKTFGRAASTNSATDIVLSNAILILGANLATEHPLLHHWATQAQEKGATLIQLGGQFLGKNTHLPLREGTGLAFAAGLIHFIIANELYFEDYLINNTNASYLVHPKFHCKDGLFSGYKPKTRNYDTATWQWQRDENGQIKQDASFTNPACVLQIIRKHYSRYSLEHVATVTGLKQEQLHDAYKAFAATGARDKAGSIICGANTSQGSTGVQYVRALAIIQLLLGNIGIAGGGMHIPSAGHNEQGVTDNCPQGEWLPGYLPAPQSHHKNLSAYIQDIIPTSHEPKAPNWLRNSNKYAISLLKSWFGEQANASNEFGFNWLPKRDKLQRTDWRWLTEQIFSKKIKGCFCTGFDPLNHWPNTSKVEQAFTRLDWLVCMGLPKDSIASIWQQAAPNKNTTECFLLPDIPATEKEGSTTSMSRWVQWQNGSPCQGRYSTGRMLVDIARKVQELYADQGGANAEGLLAHNFDYLTEKNEFAALAVAKRINGTFTHDVTINRVPFAKQQTVPGFGLLQSDGTTSCGNWLYSGCFDMQSNNLMARRNIASEADYPHSLWAFSWPVNRRVLYNRASVDLAGSPWNHTTPTIRWSETRWEGDVPDGPWAPAGQENGKLPFIMLPDGVAALFAPSCADGPLPEYYEPLESPAKKNAFSAQRINPILLLPSLKTAEANGKFPLVIASYPTDKTVLEALLAQGDNSTTALGLLPLVIIGSALAQEGHITPLQEVRVSTLRGSINAIATIDSSLPTLLVENRTVHQAQLLYTSNDHKPDRIRVQSLLSDAAAPASFACESNTFMGAIEGIKAR